ncbi:divergent polysaccharide deacetylase family protein [Shewanella sp. JM162201]|uniref:Divergent polysaccharide deacetylase family protein n=2 Tax=Shewanella jiangmenensis TaxID=2837387 RepID=A0ABS5V8A2_9GAMM|nr:divergent polysaccharide deacetylase family protein [Shewanella jiangmenensis]MBT1446198.1 divergent polysaccharide deacetylase family protein [Shewanella jiangmenensis]
MFTAQGAQLAIIIDDIGYRQTDEDVLSLPKDITLSVIPLSPLGVELAGKAHKQGYEIMLHLPMQALNGKPLGKGGLTKDMSEQEIKRKVDDAIVRIPYAKGANNHMGSLLTQMDSHMLWVMERLKQNNLYFVDSLTTGHSKAANQAEAIGVPMLKRHVFLDNDTSKKALEKQFRIMMEQAHQQGFAVAIAHPHPATVRFLKANLPRLAQEGITLVPTSHLLPYRLAQQQGTSPAVRLR